MVAIVAVLYNLIFHQALAGALASSRSLSPEAGRLSFATAATVYILSGSYLDKHDLIALFGDQHTHYRQQVSLLAAERHAAGGEVAMHQPAHARPTRNLALED